MKKEWYTLPLKEGWHIYLYSPCLAILYTITYSLQLDEAPRSYSPTFVFFVFVRYNSSLLSRPPIYRSYISRQYIVKFVNQLMYIWDRMLTSWITCIPSLVWHWYIYSTCYSLLFPSCRIGEAPRSCSTVPLPLFFN